MPDTDMQDRILNRRSVLLARARACIAGFERIGQQFSADFTRTFANALEAGAAPELYAHWIGEQEARLTAKEMGR